MSYTITDRDKVQPGDFVTWGSLGYQHRGRAIPTHDDGLRVGGSGQWYANFVSASRPRELPAGTVVLVRELGARVMKVERLDRGSRRWAVKLDEKIVQVESRRETAERTVRLASDFLALTGHVSAVTTFLDQALGAEYDADLGHYRVLYPRTDIDELFDALDAPADAEPHS